MKRFPLLLLLLPILTSCPENKTNNGKEPPQWAEMKTSFSWKEYYDAFEKLRTIQHKLYYDPSTMSIAHYCPLKEEEREILRSFNTKYLPPLREYINNKFKGVDKKEEKLGEHLSNKESVGLRNGRPSDEHLSALEKLENYTERSLHEAFQSGNIAWNDGEKKLVYSGTKDAEQTAFNELNEKSLSGFVGSYAGTAGFPRDKASDIVNDYLISLCVAKPMTDPGSARPKIGWDDRNALFMVLRNVTPKQAGGNAGKKELKAFSLYYAKKDDPNVKKIRGGAQQDLDIQLYSDYLCSSDKMVGTVSSGNLVYRPHNQLLRMVPVPRRGLSRALFFKDKDTCENYLKWQVRDNQKIVSIQEKQEIQNAIIGLLENGRGYAFDRYGIVATEPSTGLSASNDRDILFPIIHHGGDDIANLRDATGSEYGDRLYGVLAVTDQDIKPQSDEDDSLSVPPQKTPAKDSVNVLQIYFVMDLTGSMTPYKDYILNSLETNFIKPFEDKDKRSQLDVIEMGFIGYKDFPSKKCDENDKFKERGHNIASFEFPGRGDGKADCTYNYTHQGMVSPTEFKNILRQVKTAGELAEGNEAEQRRVAQDPVPEAMRRGLEAMRDSTVWQPAHPMKERRNVTRCVFVIGDAPDHWKRDKFIEDVAEPATLWASQNACTIMPIYIKDLSKQSNRKYVETAKEQFGALAKPFGYSPMIADVSNGDYATKFHYTFRYLSHALMGKAMTLANETDQDRKKIADSLSEEKIRQELCDESLELEQKLQAAAMVRHAFGNAMTIWVSKEKKKELSAFSVIRDMTWVATKDPLSFAGGVVDEKTGKTEVYSVMTPGVMLSIKDAKEYLQKCEKALQMYNESSSNGKEQKDLLFIAQLAANFLASSVDPTSLLNADPKELSKIFEQGDNSLDLPVHSRFAKELLKIMGESKGSVDLNSTIRAFSERVKILDQRLKDAQALPMEKRVFYTQEVYDRINSIWNENIGDKSALNKHLDNDDFNSQSAIVVPYEELP